VVAEPEDAGFEEAERLPTGATGRDASIREAPSDESAIERAGVGSERGLLISGADFVTSVF
jgi:hypothetical protein